MKHLDIDIMNVMLVVLLVWTCIFVALVMRASFFVGLLVCFVLLIGYKWDWIRRKVRGE